MDNKLKSTFGPWLKCGGHVSIYTYRAEVIGPVKEGWKKRDEKKKSKEGWKKDQKTFDQNFAYQMDGTLPIA